MLHTITIPCPVCGETTKIAVASYEGSELRIATTSCRECHAQFATLTEEDGRILIIDPESLHDPSDQDQIRILATIAPVTASGVSVQAPKHLGIFDRGTPPGPREAEPKGLSDEELKKAPVAQPHEWLYRPDGSKRTPKQAAKHVGWRAVWVQQLNEALEKRLQGPPPLDYPPTVFISYRWQQPAQNAWVADLAGELKQRGYPVVFDRDEPGEVDVPDLVARIADCRYFLAVLDPGYAERIGRTEDAESISDGWVFDECQIAFRFSNAKSLTLVGLLRDGTELPKGFKFPEPGRFGNAVDVRTPEKLRLFLDDAFPTLDHSYEKATIERAKAMVAASHEMLCEGRYEEAFAHAEALTALLPRTIDGPAQRIRVALASGHYDRGYAAAEEALQLRPESRELLLAVGLLANGTGRFQRAVESLALLLEGKGDESKDQLYMAHHDLAAALDEFGQVHPAIAHLLIARTLHEGGADVHTTLGYLYRRIGDTEKAIECIEAGLTRHPDSIALLIHLTAALLECGRFREARQSMARLVKQDPDPARIQGLVDSFRDPDLESGDPPVLITRVQTDGISNWVVCSNCEARIPLADSNGSLCARCGSSLKKLVGHCPLCGSDGRVYFVPGITCQCPYCREGTVRLVGSE